MKHIISILLITLLAAAPAFGQKRIFKGHQKIKPVPATTFKQKEYSVSGKVFVTVPYCGGAYPGQDVLDESRTPRPFPGKKLYVRADTLNNEEKPIVAELTSDNNGNFTIQLPPGKYCIIQEEQVKPIRSADLIKDPYTGISSEECVKSWWKKGLAVFEVTDKDIAGINIYFNKQCFVTSLCPCIQYHGPLPQ